MEESARNTILTKKVTEKRKKYRDKNTQKVPVNVKSARVNFEKKKSYGRQKVTWKK